MSDNAIVPIGFSALCVLGFGLGIGLLIGGYPTAGAGLTAGGAAGFVGLMIGGIYS